MCWTCWTLRSASRVWVVTRDDCLKSPFLGCYSHGTKTNRPKSRIWHSFRLHVPTFANETIASSTGSMYKILWKHVQYKRFLSAPTTYLGHRTGNVPPVQSFRQLGKCWGKIGFNGMLCFRLSYTSVPYTRCYYVFWETCTGVGADLTWLCRILAFKSAWIFGVLQALMYIGSSFTIFPLCLEQKKQAAQWGIQAWRWRSASALTLGSPTGVGADLI